MAATEPPPARKRLAHYARRLKESHRKYWLAPTLSTHTLTNCRSFQLTPSPRMRGSWPVPCGPSVERETSGLWFAPADKRHEIALTRP